MAQVEYACQGRLLFRSELRDGALLPRINEIVVVEETAYVVIDVEYWARRLGTGDRRALWPTVYLAELGEDDWQLRLERRGRGLDQGETPKRY